MNDTVMKVLYDGRIYYVKRYAGRWASSYTQTYGVRNGSYGTDDILAYNSWSDAEKMEGDHVRLTKEDALEVTPEMESRATEATLVALGIKEDFYKMYAQMIGIVK